MRIALRTIVALAVALCLLSLASASALADGNGNGNHDGMGKDNAPGQNMWKDKSGYMQGKGHDKDSEEKDLERMLMEGMRHGFFGRFNYSNGVMNGKFVSFELNESNGVITNYSLKSRSGPIAVFDSMSISGFAPTNLTVHGSVMLLRNGTVQIIIHDNPTGMIHIISNLSVLASFKLADGLNATEILINDQDDEQENGTAHENEYENEYEHEQGNGTGDENQAENDHEHNYDRDQAKRSVVLIAGNGMLGIIATDDGNLTVDATENGTFVNATFTNDHAVFRARPVFARHHGMHDISFMFAIAQERIAAEMTLIWRENGTYIETMEYERSFTMMVMEAKHNRIMLRISSEVHQGRVVILNVDQGTLDLLKGNSLVKLDGTEVRSTANPLEVLYATGSSSTDAVYCFTESNGTAQFLIYVPSFSVHELSVESVGPFAQVMGASGAIAVIVALAVIGVAAMVLVRRKG